VNVKPDSMTSTPASRKPHLRKGSESSCEV
jgi:hypothetical protein